MRNKQTRLSDRLARQLPDRFAGNPCTIDQFAYVLRLALGDTRGEPRLGRGAAGLLRTRRSTGWNAFRSELQKRGWLEGRNVVFVDENVRRWQNRVNPLWRRLTGGCNLNRPIPSLLETAGFRIANLSTMYIPGWKPACYNYWGTALAA